LVEAEGADEGTEMEVSPRTAKTVSQGGETNDEASPTTRTRKSIGKEKSDSEGVEVLKKETAIDKLKALSPRKMRSRKSLNLSQSNKNPEEDEELIKFSAPIVQAESKPSQKSDSTKKSNLKSVTSALKKRASLGSLKGTVASSLGNMLDNNSKRVAPQRMTSMDESVASLDPGLLKKPKSRAKRVTSIDQLYDVNEDCIGQEGEMELKDIDDAISVEPNEPLATEVIHVSPGKFPSSLASTESMQLEAMAMEFGGLAEISVSIGGAETKGESTSESKPLESKKNARRNEKKGKVSSCGNASLNRKLQSEKAPSPRIEERTVTTEVTEASEKTAKTSNIKKRSRKPKTVKDTDTSQYSSSGSPNETDMASTSVRRQRTGSQRTSRTLKTTESPEQPDHKSLKMSKTPRPSQTSGQPTEEEIESCLSDLSPPKQSTQDDSPLDTPGRRSMFSPPASPRKKSYLRKRSLKSEQRKSQQIRDSIDIKLDGLLEAMNDSGRLKDHSAPADDISVSSEKQKRSREIKYRTRAARSGDTDDELDASSVHSAPMLSRKSRDPVSLSTTGFSKKMNKLSVAF